MQCTIKISKWLVAGLTFWGLVGCGGDDGVEGTGADSDDLQLVQTCFAQAPEGDCATADFNKDGYINYGDLVLMKSATKYDLNQDGIVDTRAANDNADLAILTECQAKFTEDCSSADFNNDNVVDDTDEALFQTAAQFDVNNDQFIDVSKLQTLIVEYSEDLAILLDCLYEAPVDACASSDLNGDQVIDLNDTDTFVAAAIYDLNGDNIIDFSNDTPDDLNNVKVNEDLKIIRDCFFKSTEEFPDCAIADFDGNAIVNFTDLGKFSAARKFDLNADGFADLRVVIESQDLVFIKLCFFQAADNKCAIVDFNGDDIINVNDLGEFKASGRFDVTGDGLVDLYGTEADSDYGFIDSCSSQTSGPCMAADFNADGVVDDTDMDLFKAADKYDVNFDGYVDLRVQDALESRDLRIIKTCFFRAAEGECAKADFNNDEFINAADLAEFKLSGRFDLSGDSIIDLHGTETNADRNFITDCLNQSTEICLNADFDNNGVVNDLDREIFNNSSKYDLNNDQFVDVRG